MRTLDTYHTCRDQGGAKFILSNAPFISEDNSRQWLGQGFYFWYGSLDLAKEWGHKSVQTASYGYVVLSVVLRLKQEYIFDLVGEPQHMQIFEKYAKAYTQELTKAKVGAADISVSELMSVLRATRKEIGFDFRAVKVATQKTRELRRFIPGKNEVLGSNPRQQICVFPEYKCAIFKVHIEKPEGWKGKFKGVRKWTNMKRALRHFVSYWKR